MSRILLFLLALTLSMSGVLAQADDATGVALQHARQLAAHNIYTAADVADLTVDHSYTDTRLGITYVYLQQQVGAVDIKGAVATIGMRGERVYSFTHRLVDGVQERLTSVVPRLDDGEAISVAATSLGEKGGYTARRPLDQTAAQGQRLYAQPDYATRPLAVEDYFLLCKDGKLRRTLAVHIFQRSSGTYYEVAVDAATGEVLQTENHTIRCSFGHDYLGAHASGDCDVAPDMSYGTPAYLSTATSNSGVGDGSSYRVFPWPAESPSHGPQVLVTEPADSVASPFGWHDTDGAVGPEFTITRGNNTHAYLDQFDNDEPSADEPDGGPSLTFNFPYDPDLEPVEMTDVTVTNLFYAVNQMHDFSYQYGFDEAAGNFQENNYGRGRTTSGGSPVGDGDYVFAQSQDGGTILTGTGTPDVDHTNNAQFTTPGDGSNGKMEMFLWNRNNIGNPLTIVSPQSLIGTNVGEPATVDWTPGARITASTDVIAGVVDARDAVPNVSFTDACEPLLNAAEIAGKIALIDRGTCEFGSKALRAQNAGAAAVIICNFESTTIAMAPGDDGGDVTIPTLMLPLDGCQRIRAFAASNPDFQMRVALPLTSSTTYVSGSLDNGIVAHEYGHGISLRLTGGPNTICLNNVEQMGEGWSDFFTLVTSAKSTDAPEMVRGIGTYAIREAVNGRGIRPFPYSTDINVNPVTYADVANAGEFEGPHEIGSIWASMLWDLHWNLVDEYGFSTDLRHGQLGNNKAILLVMTGLKLQPCNPGFVDGRNAILAADSLLSADPTSWYGPSNEKLIWETFARRGLGFDADQGDQDDRSDGVTNFSIPPVLANTAFFTKIVSPTVAPGGDVDVRLVYANWFDDPLPAATITDELPAGASLITSSVSHPFTQNGDVLSFEFTNLVEGDSIIVEYVYTAPDDAPSVYWYEPIADDNGLVNWESENVIPTGNVFWVITEQEGYLDNASWYVEGTLDENQPYFGLTPEQAISVRGDNPVLSFYTKYDLDLEHEGGIVEYFNEDESRWIAFKADKFLRNGYDAVLTYQTFVIPFLDGFGGTQIPWQQTLLDLSDFVGQDLRLRWRYGREGEGNDLHEGWWVDEISAIDAITYNTSATLTTNVIEPITVNAANIGTFVEASRFVDVEDVADAASQFRAFPNPTSDEVTLFWDQQLAAGTVSVYTATGQLAEVWPVSAGARRLSLSLANSAAGLYTIRIQRGDVEQTVRVVKR